MIPGPGEAGAPEGALLSGTEEIRRAGRTSVAVSGVSLFSYALNVVRVTLIAALFGVSRSLDAFYLALAVPVFLEGLFFGAFQSVFVPAYQRALAASPGAARELARRSLAAALALLAILAALLAAAPAAVVAAVGSGLPPAVRAESAAYLRMLAPLLLLEGAGQILSGVLQARKRYVFPALASLGALAASIAWLVARSGRGPVALVEATLVGGGVLAAATAAAVFPTLRRDGPPAVSPRLAWGGYALVLFTFALTGLNPVVDQAFAAYLAPGDVAAYGYATRLYEVVWQLVFAGAGVVLLPLLSGQLARDRPDEARKTLGSTFQASFLLFAPIAIGILLAGRPFISLVFERGAFGREAAVRVWRIWGAISPALLFAAWGTALNRLLYAAGRAPAILIASAANLAINAAADWILMRPFGVVGIGAATTVRALATLLLLWALVPPELRRVLPLSREGPAYARATAALLPLTAGAWFVGRTPMSWPLYLVCLAALAGIQYALFRWAVPEWVARLASVARRKRSVPAERAL